jgi:hypothetical protein
VRPIVVTAGLLRVAAPLEVPMKLSARLLTALATSATRRAARIRHATLVRELADYTSASDRQDLEAILARYPDGTTHELRSILASQAMDRSTRNWAAMNGNPRG